MAARKVLKVTLSTGHARWVAAAHVVHIEERGTHVVLYLSRGEPLVIKGTGDAIALDLAEALA